MMPMNTIQHIATEPGLLINVEIYIQIITPKAVINALGWFKYEKNGIENIGVLYFNV